MPALKPPPASFAAWRLVALPNALVLMLSGIGVDARRCNSGSKPHSTSLV